MIGYKGLSLFLFAAPVLCTAQERATKDAGHKSDSAGAVAQLSSFGGSHDYSIRAFPRALASNMVGLVSRGNIVPVMLGVGLTVTARPFDDGVRDAVADQATGVGDLGDFMGDRVAFTSAIVGLFTAGQIAPAGIFRSATFDLAQGLIVNAAVVTVLKRSFGRQRPDSTNYHSFPSGHTSSFFMMATVLSRHLGRRAGLPATVAATFVAVSRVEDNEHFLSDIVAGGVLGFIVGRTVTAHLGRRLPAGEPRTSVTPFLVQRGGGIHVRLAF